MATQTTEIELTVGSRQDSWETHWLPWGGKISVGLAKKMPHSLGICLDFFTFSSATLGTGFTRLGIDIFDHATILGHPGIELLLVGQDLFDRTEILGQPRATIDNQMQTIIPKT
jgi:hypothetical protein